MSLVELKLIRLFRCFVISAILYCFYGNQLLIGESRVKPDDFAYKVIIKDGQFAKFFTETDDPIFNGATDGWVYMDAGTTDLNNWEAPLYKVYWFGPELELRETVVKKAEWIFSREK